MSSSSSFSTDLVPYTQNNTTQFDKISTQELEKTSTKKESKSGISANGLLGLAALMTIMGGLGGLTPSGLSSVGKEEKKAEVKHEAPKIIDPNLVEGLPNFKCLSFDKIKEKYEYQHKQYVFKELERDFPKTNIFKFEHENDILICIDSMWPNLNGEGLVFSDNIKKFKVSTVYNFTLFMFRRAQIRIYTFYNKNTIYKFGFDTRMLKVEIWTDDQLKIKVFFILGVDEFEICYYKCDNFDMYIKHLSPILKLLNPLFENKIEIYKFK